MDFTASTVVGLAGLGLLAGTAGGLLGIGGGVINVPGLTLLFGAAAPLARSATLVLNALIGLSSTWRHHRARCVLPQVVGLMLLGGLIGGALGAVLAHWLDRWTWVFPGVFATFLAFMIVQNVRRLIRPGRDEEVWHASGRAFAVTARGGAALVAVGFPMGLLAGLLGIGGGAIAVPMQEAVARMPLRNAIACSSSAIVGTCAAAAAVAIVAGSTGSAAAFLWWEPLLLAAVLVPTAVVGALAGAHLTHVLPLRLVRLVLVAVILVSCVKMAQQSVGLYRSGHSAPATQEAHRP